MAKGIKGVLMPNERKLNHPDMNYAFHPFAVERISSRSSRIPRARSGHRIVCNNNTLFCFGGYNPSGVNDITPIDPRTWTESNPLFKELWSYSISNRIWKLLPVHESIPDELASNAVCLEDKTLMIYGGTGSPFGLRCSNMLHIYHISGEKGGLKRVNTQGQVPSPQYGQAIMYHDGYLYTVGGTNGYNYTSDIHRLHLRTKIWESIFTCTGNTSDEPPGRYRHEMAFDGLNLYILAGGTAETAFDFTKIPIFNIETRTWVFKQSKPDPRSAPGYPMPRMCHSAVQINNENNIHVFVIGGTGGDTIFDDIWRLEIPSLQWTLLTKTVLPKKIHFHSSTITPAGCVYTFGGVELKNGTYIRTSTMYKVWICIPKLSEMAWESILHYNPKIGNINRNKLLLSGIPKDFVDRLE